MRPVDPVDADDLYRLEPEAFTAARDAAAKQARADGDKDRAAKLKSLRKPSVAAWLVNRLATEQAELLAQLLDLGPELAQAQAGRDATALLTLGAQRRQLVDAVVGSAVDAAGRAVTATVREEVAATLEAALADPASAEAVRSGRLVRSLAYAGFGEVDLAGAVAPSRGPATTKPATTKPATAKGKAGPDPADLQRQRVAAAEAAALDASGRLDDAVRACEQAERNRTAAALQAERAGAEVDRLAAALEAARHERDQAVRTATAAQTAADKALGKVRRAQEAADAARAELDRLRRT